jgi:ABC-2 type transport system ATP-binding protein
MLECKNLEFSYGPVKRLKNISFDLTPGIFGLFGQNGSGKSTLLKILGGSLPAQKGHIKIHGQNALGPDSYVQAHLRKNFGILFQENSSDEKISVRHNLFYASLLMGVNKNKINSLIDDVLILSGLKDRAHDPVKKLSGGMRRKLELYRTFIHRPKILLLDEPTAGLDVEETEKFQRFLCDYQEKNQSLVIISSHNPRDFISTKRILLISSGIILADSSLDKLLSNLNYLQLTFRLHNDIFNHKDLAMFDVAHDKKNALLTAKITPEKLAVLLQDKNLFSNNFMGFQVDKPNLADAYQLLVQNFLGSQHDRHN